MNRMYRGCLTAWLIVIGTCMWGCEKRAAVEVPCAKLVRLCRAEPSLAAECADLVVSEMNGAVTRELSNCVETAYECPAARKCLQRAIAKQLGP